MDPEGQLTGVHPLAHHPGFQVLSGPFGDDVHPAVHGQNHDERDVEGAEGGEERVKWLFGDGAHRVVRRRRLLPPEQRSDGNNHRQRPHPEHGQQSPLLRHDARVLQRVAHSDVAVDGYYAQAHDGRGAAQHIHRRPDVTEDPPEHPVVQDLQSGGHRQHRGAQQQVGNSQINDEVVRRGAQVPVAHHREDDKDVARDGEHDESPKHQAEWDGSGEVHLAGLRVVSPGAVGKVEPGGRAVQFRGTIFPQECDIVSAQTHFDSRSPP